MNNDTHARDLFPLNVVDFVSFPLCIQSQPPCRRPAPGLGASSARR